MSTDEEKYKNLRNQLRSLPRMRAKKDFDTRLFARIKELESAKHIRPALKPERDNVFVNWLANLLRPSMVPAIGLTVVLLVAVVVYFAYYNKLNEQDTKVTQEISYADKNGEFVIYVKKDGERVFDETSHDITSADLESSPGTDYRAPSDVSTETYITEPKPELKDETHDKFDRISPEQKYEMEKESKKESDDTKVRSKSDDVIMKKGYEKSEKKEAPSNYDRPKSEDSGEQYQEEKNGQKFYDQDQNEQIRQENKTDEEKQKDSSRLAERKKLSKKDSLKVKDQKIEEQDSIEK